jgi:hypothetical protein
MPRYPGVYKKLLPSGARYYGSVWQRRPGESRGKLYTTKLYATAGEAARARAILARDIERGLLVCTY